MTTHHNHYGEYWSSNDKIGYMDDKMYGEQTEQRALVEETDCNSYERDGEGKPPQSLCYDSITSRSLLQWCYLA